jgi:hypothetical protein
VGGKGFNDIVVLIAAKYLFRAQPRPFAPLRMTGIGTLRMPLVVVANITLLCCALYASAKEGKPAKRARPPKWSADVLDAFFDDARTKLVGARPDFESKQEANAIADDSPPLQSPGEATPPADGAWSKLIDSETIETEIKRLGSLVAADVKTPSGFKGGSYKDCRRHFSVLATLFAIAAEYDGDVRWKETAAGLRDQFARAGRNCKVGTDQTFQEASARKQELADLITGTRPQVSEADPAANWSEVVDRPPLMQRLNIAQEERLTKWLASDRDFKQHRDEIRHEAQLIAAFADIIAREGYEFADDEQFSQFARDLRQSAATLAAAANVGNYPQARQAGNGVTKACANCHEGYRG